MSLRRKLFFVLIIIFVLMQFIRPSKNLGTTDESKSIAASSEVRNILQTSCYDCHSNYTHYPWYVNIQPIGWWLNHHLNEVKDEINFSEFNTYKLKRKLRKMKEIKEQLEDDEMPIYSYTFIHSEAKLSPEEKGILLKWVDETRAVLADTIH